MGRRQGGILTDLMKTASGWSWTVSAALIPISFAGCHWVATSLAHTPPPASPRDLGLVAIRQGVSFAASLLQYILPLLFAIAAGVSQFRRARAQRVLNEVRTGVITDIQTLDWPDFERLVGAVFRLRGFVVKERGGAGPDGGVDLELTRGTERVLVQCKQWRALKVGVSVVRELYGVMAAERVAGGYVVTAGSFTRDARDFAAGRNIELIDGPGLDRLIQHARPDAPSTRSTPDPADPTVTSSSPCCPRCHTAMVLRTAGKGNHVGRHFWGCAAYPKCHETKPWA